MSNGLQDREEQVENVQAQFTEWMARPTVQ